MLHYVAVGTRILLVSSRKQLVVRMLWKAGFQLVTDVESFAPCSSCGWATLR